MNRTIGNLRLTNVQEDQLVEFLKALSDGYKPQQVSKK